MQKIATLVIEHFRALRQLKIEGLGRINLITGRNNTGKSSVILRPFVFWQPMHRRLSFSTSFATERKILADTEDANRPIDVENMFLMSGLFHGFPQVLTS